MNLKGLLLTLFACLFAVFQSTSQEVPEEIEFAGISLKIEKKARYDIQNRVNLLLENPKSFDNKLRVADLFLPVVHDLLKQFNLPSDLKYLALLDNTSPDSLIFWQMQKDLAINLGLRINHVVDERENIFAVTKAVAAYLNNNQNTLNNWMLTMLSYHLSLDGVKAYFNKVFPNADLNVLSRLKVFPIVKDTHPDILQLIAYYVAFRDAIGKNVKMDTELLSFTQANNKSFQQIAEELSLKESEIKRYNPWLKSSVIPNDKLYEVVIPIPTASPTREVRVFTAANGESVYETDVESLLHIVESGETLYGISRLYKVPVKELMQWNKLNEQSKILIGQKLIVASPNAIVEENTTQETIIHNVSKGETLYRISKLYSISVNEVKTWNQLSGDNLFVGQKLKINKKKSDSDKIEVKDKGKDLDNSKDLPIDEQKDKAEDKKDNPNPDKNPVKIAGVRIVKAKQVPLQLSLAGINLNISAKAREMIQKDVDMLIRNQKYFLTKVARVDLYMPLIEEVLSAQSVPLDFKYLPIQESALIGNAISRSDAVGYWQFKEPSAKDVGLEVSNKVDERMNIVAASLGASKYLKRNNAFNNNWLTTLLSYNMGYTGAKNYMAQNYPDKDFRNITEIEINEKTHWYIRKFIAHKIVFEEELGLEKPDKKLDKYTQGSRKSLKEIAAETGSDADEMKPFNLWLKRPKVPEEKVYSVIVPLKN